MVSATMLSNGRPPRQIVKPSKPVKVVEKLPEPNVVVPENLEVSQENLEAPQETPREVFDSKLVSLLNVSNLLVKQVRDLDAELKRMRVLYQKTVKDIERESKRKRKRNGSTTISENSIFKRPTRITPELAQFLGLDNEATVLRPNVTRQVCLYIKENNLRDPNNKSLFVPDRKLKKLLGEARFPIMKSKPELGNGYSHRNLQSYVSRHYIKSE